MTDRSQGYVRVGLADNYFDLPREAFQPLVDAIMGGGLDFVVVTDVYGCRTMLRVSDISYVGEATPEGIAKVKAEEEDEAIQRLLHGDEG